MQPDDRYRTPRLRVAAVIFHEDAVLLVKHLKNGRYNYLLPGGGVGYGETLHEALVRELIEEARVHIRPGRFLFISESIAPNEERHMVQLAFEASIVGGTPALGEDPRVVDLEFVPVDAMAKLEMLPPVQEALIRGVREGFPACPSYLGNLWRDILS